jgi:hypothetical protein
VCACFSKPVSIPRPAPPPSTPPPTTPVPPVFELDLWPGEGIPVVHPVRSELALHGAASLSAPVATVVRVPLNTPLQYDTTRYQTIRPGRVRVLTSAKVLGRDFGDIRRLSSEAYYRGGARPASLDVAPTTIFDYLQYRAEGTCFVRIEGRVVDADPCPVQDKTAFRLESDPRLLWWIHVRTANGAGWLVLSDTTVREVSRTF